MKITKFLHSCILMEENEKRLLIDPGEISFSLGSTLKPQDIGPVDVILYTHRHFDHFYLEALQSFVKIGSPAVITNPELTKIIGEGGLSSQIIESGEVRTVAGFTIEALNAPHEPIFSNVPRNLAYLINQTFLHPGDSLSISLPTPPKVLALPITGSWMKIVEGLVFAKNLKPEKIIPIHDGILKDFMRLRAYEGWQEELAKININFHTLETGAPLKL